MAFLMQTLADVRPADSILVEESPSSRRTMQAHLPIDRADSFFTCASGGLGHSLPAAVGMALATSPHRRVIGLFGDGSAMYSIQALWSAADLKLPLAVVIVNNRGYAALSEFSSHFNMKELVGTRLPGTRLRRPRVRSRMSGHEGGAAGGSGRRSREGIRLADTLPRRRHDRFCREP